MPTDSSQVTILRTMESCSLGLMSGAQSVMTEKYFAFFTLFTIASLLFSLSLQVFCVLITSVIISF